MPTQRNSWVKPYVNAWVDHIKLFSCAYVRSRKKEKGVRKNVSWPRWLTLSYLLTTTFKRYATVDLCKSFPPSVNELSRGNVCIDQQTAPIPVVAPEAQSKKKEAPSLESWATHGFIKKPQQHTHSTELSKRQIVQDQFQSWCRSLTTRHIWTPLLARPASSAPLSLQ